jgi:prolyl-tRNA synthetase
VWATSWGVSTRLVGAVIMTHSDDTGLVLPPRVAPIQVVITPIWRKEKDRAEVMAFAERVQAALSGRVRVHLDDRDNMKPGAKYFEWERKGVPLRFEVGPRDVANNSVFCKRRVGGDKFGIELTDDFADTVAAELDAIQGTLLANATAARDARTFEIESYDAMKAQMTEEAGFYVVPWHDDAEAEKQIKDDCKATIRCYPLDLQDQAAGKTCFYSGRPATHMAIFARAY